MGKTTLKWAIFALLAQIAVGLPSFGRDAQREQWNEVDDENPGESLPFDFKMPMRVTDGDTEDRTTETTTLQEPEKSSRVTQPLNTGNNILNPVPDNIITTEKHESNIAPVNTDDGIAPAKKHSETLPKLQEVEPKKETSEKLTVTTSEPITDDTIPNQEPERLTTVKPQTISKHFTVDDTTVKSEKNTNSLPTPKKNDHSPMLIVRIIHPSPKELPAPSPTPRPPTEDEEEDCECVECEEAIEKQKSGATIGEGLDCQDADVLPPNIEKGSDNDNVKVIRTSPLSLLQTGKQDETLENIFNDVVRVMGRMTSSNKVNLLKSIPFSKTEEEKMGLQNEKDMPKIIAGIIKVSKVNSNIEDDSPCDMEDNDDQERSSQNPASSFDQSPFNSGSIEPIAKGILLKSLLSKHTMTPEDILEIMRDNRRKVMERNMITSLNDLFQNMVNKPARFGALHNEGYTSHLPPLRFPEENGESFTRNNESSDIPIIIKTRPTINPFSNGIINSLSPPKLSVKLSSYNTFGNPDQNNDHLQKFGPQISGLMDILQQIAEHEASNFRKNDVPLSFA